MLGLDFMVKKYFVTYKVLCHNLYSHHITQLSSVAQSCLPLCGPVACSTPGFSVHQQLPELAQTHVHQVGDAIQPTHPLLSLLFLPSIFPSIKVFPNESALCINLPNYWNFNFSISPSNKYSKLIFFKIH